MALLIRQLCFISVNSHVMPSPLYFTLVKKLVQSVLVCSYK